MQSVKTVPIYKKARRVGNGQVPTTTSVQQLFLAFDRILDYFLVALGLEWGTRSGTDVVNADGTIYYRLGLALVLVDGAPHIMTLQREKPSCRRLFAPAVCQAVIKTPCILHPERHMFRRRCTAACRRRWYWACRPAPPRSRRCCRCPPSRHCGRTISSWRPPWHARRACTRRRAFPCSCPHPNLCTIVLAAAAPGRQ